MSPQLGELNNGIFSEYLAFWCSTIEWGGLMTDPRGPRKVKSLWLNSIWRLPNSTHAWNHWLVARYCDENTKTYGSFLGVVFPVKRRRGDWLLLLAPMDHPYVSQCYIESCVTRMRGREEGLSGVTSTGNLTVGCQFCCIESVSSGCLAGGTTAKWNEVILRWYMLIKCHAGVLSQTECTGIDTSCECHGTIHKSSRDYWSVASEYRFPSRLDKYLSVASLMGY